MGTPEYAVPTLSALVEAGHENGVVGVDVIVGAIVSRLANPEQLSHAIEVTRCGKTRQHSPKVEGC